MTPVQQATRAAEGYLELRMPNEAWEELESLEPDLRANPAVLALRVRIYLAKGMPAPAAIVALGWVCVEPWSMLARELAAKVLEEQGRFDAALAVFEGTPPEVTKDAVHYFHEGRLLVRLGRVEEGKVRLAKAVDIDKAMQERIVACDELEAIW